MYLNLIKQIVTITSDTLVVLASTLYFNASWQDKFELLPRNQAQKLCYSSSIANQLSSQCSPVTWMTKEENIFHHKFSGTVNAQAFEIPLKNGKSGKNDITNKVSF